MQYVMLNLLDLILPLVLFNFIQNQSVGLVFFFFPLIVWTFLHQGPLRLSNLLVWVPFWAFPIASSSTALSDRPFLLILSLDAANSGQKSGGGQGQKEKKKRKTDLRK